MLMILEVSSKIPQRFQKLQNYTLQGFLGCGVGFMRNPLICRK